MPSASFNDIIGSIYANNQAALDATRATPSTLAGAQVALEQARASLATTNAQLAQAQGDLAVQQTTGTGLQGQVRMYQIVAGVAAVAAVAATVYAVRRR